MPSREGSCTVLTTSCREGVPKGKGSDEHRAAVVGDTVGDPFKDTSGPSINILIKLMAVISLVFVGGFDNTSWLAGPFNIQRTLRPF